MAGRAGAPGEGGTTDLDPRTAARGVPHSRDRYQFSLNIEAVDNTIWAKDDLADSWISVFGNDATCFGMLLQNVCSCYQLISERLCAPRIVTGNKADDVAQIVTRSR